MKGHIANCVRVCACVLCACVHVSMGLSVCRLSVCLSVCVDTNLIQNCKYLTMQILPVEERGKYLLSVCVDFALGSD